MGMPSGVGIIDLMIGIPSADSSFEFLKPLVRDGSVDTGGSPVGYLFSKHEKPVAAGVGGLLEEMDRWGIERGMIPVGKSTGKAARAIAEHPGRLFGSFEVDPNQGMAGLRALQRAHDEIGIKAATASPIALHPQVPIDHARFYPFYAKCVELDIPMCITAGVPGPRVPFAAQHVERLDQVCYDFPELRLVTRHGCEPWTALAVKLLLKWPNLYFSTSGFAPKHYSPDIIEFANTRGSDKILYAGYFPTGLTLERIATELPNVSFRDHVWLPFLRDNAIRVFNLEQGS